MANMSNVLGIVFANMHDTTISDLTKRRTMGSVPFGARYRLIDFPLSNMVNSGITNVGVITKANYQSLLDHLGSGAEWDLSRKTGGLHLLPPYGHVNGGLYRGRLEALAGVEDYLAHGDTEYVVMTDSDVIINIDYKPIVDFHEKNGADITAVYAKNTFTKEQLKTKVVLGVNDAGLVYDVVIRPETIEGETNVSLNMYVMKRDFLLTIVKECASRNLYSFEVDILQHKLKDLKICGYKYNGYYEQVDSIKSYYSSNMALMDKKKRDLLFDMDNPIYTKVRDDAPAKYGLDARVTNSLVADGCIIEGIVENSVLFRGVKVGKGAIVKNCILMQDTVIGDKAEINYVITDKEVITGSYRTMNGTIDYPIYVAKGASV